MAKRNIRKTDPEIAGTPEPRQASTDDSTGRAAAPKTTRSRRKTDAATAAPASVSPDVTSNTAEAASESPAGRAARRTDAPATAPAFTTVAEVASVELSHDRIAERAYHLYLERGRQPGDPFADWLTAERELRERVLGA